MKSLPQSTVWPALIAIFHAGAAWAQSAVTIEGHLDCGGLTGTSSDCRVADPGSNVFAFTRNNGVPYLASGLYFNAPNSHMASLWSATSGQSGGGLTSIWSQPISLTFMTTWAHRVSASAANGVIAHLLFEPKPGSPSSYRLMLHLFRTGSSIPTLSEQLAEGYQYGFTGGTDLGVSNDGSRVAVVYKTPTGTSASVRIYNGQSGSLLSSHLLQNTLSVNEAVLSGLGNVLMVNVGAGALQLLNTATGAVQTHYVFSMQDLRKISISDDGARIGLCGSIASPANRGAFETLVRTSSGGYASERMVQGPAGTACTVGKVNDTGRVSVYSFNQVVAPYSEVQIRAHRNLDGFELLNFAIHDSQMPTSNVFSAKGLDVDGRGRKAVVTLNTISNGPVQVFDLAGGTRVFEGVMHPGYPRGLSADISWDASRIVVQSTGYNPSSPGDMSKRLITLLSMGP
jgi:hypothetical protein